MVLIAIGIAVQLGSLLQRSEVVPEILDVLVAQRAGDAGHAARVVGPHAILYR